MSETFNVGDTVQLKSGGPYMTIETITGDEVTCVWFEKTKRNSASFTSATLVKSSPAGVAVCKLSSRSVDSKIVW